MIRVHLAVSNGGSLGVDENTEDTEDTGAGLCEERRLRVLRVLHVSSAPSPRPRVRRRRVRLTDARTAHASLTPPTAA